MQLMYFQLYIVSGIDVTSQLSEMASTDTGKPRLRRTLSYNKVEELGEKERKQRMKQPDKP